jgi:hypothetical protein
LASQSPTRLADGLGLGSALSRHGIRPDKTVPPHPGLNPDFGVTIKMKIFIGLVKVKQIGEFIIVLIRSEKLCKGRSA